MLIKYGTNMGEIHLVINCIVKFFCLYLKINMPVVTRNGMTHSTARTMFCKVRKMHHKQDTHWNRTVGVVWTTNLLPCTDDTFVKFVTPPPLQTVVIYVWYDCSNVIYIIIYLMITKTEFSSAWERALQSTV